MLGVTNAEKPVINKIAGMLVEVDRKQRSKWNGKDSVEVITLTEECIGLMLEVEELFKGLGGDTSLIQEAGTVFSRAYQGVLGYVDKFESNERKEWVKEMVMFDLRNQRSCVK